MSGPSIMERKRSVRWLEAAHKKALNRIRKLESVCTDLSEEPDLGEVCQEKLAALGRGEEVEW